MYSTYDGAKRRAWALQRWLRSIDLGVPLNVCQHALARGGDYRDWSHLRGALRQANPTPPNLEGFAERAFFEMPTLAVDATRRWAETELSRLEDGKRGLQPAEREISEWLDRTSEFTFAIEVMHRTGTPLMLPGSPPGMRLRRQMVWGLCQVTCRGRLDRTSLTLSFTLPFAELFFLSKTHRQFEREFQRLGEVGILEWDADRHTLILHPPPVEIVRKHVALRRELNAEYWREQALRWGTVTKPG